MNKVLYIILGIVAIVAFWFYYTYNTMIEREEKVHKSWSQVENVYQRRNDLIPNIVNVVKSYSEFEKSTIVKVTEARSIALSTQVNDNSNTESISNFDKAQQNVGEALNQLIVSVENYPELKTSEHFLTLNTELDGCENRIKVERRNYNKAAEDFNRFIRVFPNSMIANSLGFKKMAYFENNEDSQNVPSVNL